jgi:hypothetical protein
MLETLLKNFLPRIVQDILTSGAAVLVAHGYITTDQQQGLIGSAFFIAMLIINYVISQNRKANAAHAGANAVGASISAEQAATIAKGKIP